MNIPTFSTVRLPRIIFGEGTHQQLPSLVRAYGRKVLLVTGATSFRSTVYWSPLEEALDVAGVQWSNVIIDGEPSPQQVDQVVAQFYQTGINSVLGIGGGSVLDAAKAIAGLLLQGHSVMDYLEGVGRGLDYEGPSVPFIAVPTTAGTGSEATMNAVLSVQGRNGYKKSFRHSGLVAEIAVVDPLLLASCPPALIAANGMDAFTQLMESYLSCRANPLTDALAWSGLQAMVQHLFAAWEGGDSTVAREGRAGIAYGALISGITLAQVGLGSVHGLASPLGAYFPIPHGVVCGTLVAAATEKNISSLRQRQPDSQALDKYAQLGRLLHSDTGLTDLQAWEALVTTLHKWVERLDIPVLSHYGVTTSDLQRIVAACRGGSMRTNPIVLTDDEVCEIIVSRL
ncbi:iron-containing alcohol dehydrogenase [Gammaproteobacteria bacterium AH-315-K14]|nr:iron-containing alcohol dehydrogenase [Gammaproteobacteria bacterium AH-315-K14]